MLYTRPQLRLLVLLATALLAGLGVSHWRAGFPALADRLERFDRDEPGPSTFVEDRPGPRGAGAARPRTASSATTMGARARAGAVDAVEDPRPLDLNRASVEQIARLPGVGPALAARVVAERERRGGFESPEALRRVLGFGPKKLALVRDLVSASVPARATAEPAAHGAVGEGEGPRPAADAR